MYNLSKYSREKFQRIPSLNFSETGNITPIHFHYSDSDLKEYEEMVKDFCPPAEWLIVRKIGHYPLSYIRYSNLNHQLESTLDLWLQEMRHIEDSITMPMFVTAYNKHEELTSFGVLFYMRFQIKALFGRAYEWAALTDHLRLTANALVKHELKKN